MVVIFLGLGWEVCSLSPNNTPYAALVNRQQSQSVLGAAPAGRVGLGPAKRLGTLALELSPKLTRKPASVSVASGHLAVLMTID